MIGIKALITAYMALTVIVVGGLLWVANHYSVYDPASIVNYDSQLGHRELIAIEDDKGKKLVLTRGMFVESTLERRSYYPNKASYYVDQAALYHSLKWPNANMLFVDGEQIFVQDFNASKSSLFKEAWLILICGFAAWGLGVVAWIRHPYRSEIKCLPLFTAGYFGLATSSAMIELDGVVWHPVAAWFWQQLFAVSHLVFLIFAVAVLVYIPKQSWRGFFTLKAVFVSSMGALILGYLTVWQTDQITHLHFLFLPDQFLYGAIVIAFFSAVGILLMQWFFNKSEPVARLQLSWLSVAYLCGPILYLVLYLLPMLFNQQPVLERSWTWPVLLLSIAAIVFVVDRIYRLQRDIFLTLSWQWTLLTFLFVMLDGVLIYFMQLSSQASVLIVSIVLIWVYLPCRFLINQRLKQQHQQRYSKLLNKGVEQVFSLPKGADKWPTIFSELFNPVGVTLSNASAPSQVIGNGRCLHVYSGNENKNYDIEYANQGERLFYQYDLELIGTLQFLESQLDQYQQAFNAGKEQERKRILRDLHDQVGHQLLSLVYAAPDKHTQAMAQSVLSQIKHIIRSLQIQSITLGSLTTALSDLASQFSDSTGVEVNWRDDTDTPEMALASDCYLNLTNVVRELLSNSVRHGEAKNILISMKNYVGHLTVQIKDDGIGFDRNAVVEGNGLQNIAERIEELSGEIQWIEQQGTYVSITIPWENNRAKSTGASSN